MPGVWLGENTIPELLETQAGSFRFSHSTERKLWPGILFVAVVGLPCTIMCYSLALYGEGPIDPAVMRVVLFLFTATVVGGFAWACWGASSTIFETRLREVRREYYFLGKRFCVLRYPVYDQDFLVLRTDSYDEHGTGGYHYIYLCRARPLCLFAAIHLPSIAPNDELLAAVDTIAALLRIESRGYVGTTGLFGLWLRHLTGRT